MKFVNVGYLLTYDLAEEPKKVAELGQTFTTDNLKNIGFIIFFL